MKVFLNTVLMASTANTCYSDLIWSEKPTGEPVRNLYSLLIMELSFERIAILGGIFSAYFPFLCKSCKLARSGISSGEVFAFECLSFTSMSPILANDIH